MKNFKTAIDRTGTTSVAGWINYICMMLLGKSLSESYGLSSQNSAMASAHLKHIMEGLIGYSPLINTLSKKKRLIHLAMRKP